MFACLAFQPEREKQQGVGGGALHGVCPLEGLYRTHSILTSGGNVEGKLQETQTYHAGGPLVFVLYPALGRCRSRVAE